MTTNAKTELDVTVSGKRTITIKTNQKAIEIQTEFEIQHEPVVKILANSYIVVGYTSHDDNCANPLEDQDGIGKIYDARQRHSSQDKAYYKALGFNPHAVLLDVYEHSGTAWSIAGEGMNDRWDTSQAAGVWVPDDSCLEHIKSKATIPDGEYIEAVACAKQAVDLYNQWLAGDCYGICIEVFNPEGESVENDACWGYIGSDYAEKQVLEDVAFQVEKWSKNIEFTI